MADYHSLSFAEKRKAALDALRPPPMRCPLCGYGLPASDLLAHLDERCPGRPAPHRRDRWISARDVQALGMNRSTARRLAQRRGAGAIRARGRGRGRQYLERDVVEALAARRVFVAAPQRARRGAAGTSGGLTPAVNGPTIEAEMEKLLTTAQLAEYLGVAVRTLKRWREHGGGPPALRFGRAVRYRPADVETWMAANKAPAP